MVLTRACTGWNSIFSTKACRQRYRSGGIPVGSDIGVEASSINNITPVRKAHIGVELQNAQPSGEHPEHRHFNCLVSGNKVPGWFSYHKEPSNCNSCEIDIDEVVDLDREITTIAFSAIVGIKDGQYDGTFSVSAYVISGGVEIYHGNGAFHLSGSNYVWLHFHVPESFKLKAYNDPLQVVCFSDSKSKVFKSCGFHLLRRHEEKVIDSIYVTGLTKRARDDDDDEDDGNLESNWYPQQKRHSSTLGIRISDAEDTPLGES